MLHQNPSVQKKTAARSWVNYQETHNKNKEDLLELGSKLYDN